MGRNCLSDEVRGYLTITLFPSTMLTPLSGTYVARATNQSDTKYYLQKSVAFSFILLSLPCLSEFCHDLISAAKVRVISDMTDSEQLFVSQTLIDTIESDNRRF